jgi:hypothetical protein
MQGDLFARDLATGLQSQLPGLHVTPPAALPFLRGVVVRSFVLDRATGNVVIYNAPGLGAAASDILALGRPERMLVTVERQPPWPVASTTLAGGAGRKTGMPVWRAVPPAA